MPYRDTPISDVLVVLDARHAQHLPQTLQTLQSAGLSVEDVNEDEGVVEGTIEAGKVADLRKVPGVSYVRSEFTYIAAHPTGEARDRGW